MSEAQTIIDTIQVKREQQRFDLEVLALWAHAEETTGYTHEQIRTFTFRPEFLTAEEKKADKQHFRLHRKPKYCDKNWHNALRLRDECVVAMPGIQRPIPPCWTNSSVEKVIGT